MNTEDYSESTEPIDAVNILPLARFEPTTSATPPSTTPDINASNCATEPSSIYMSADLRKGSLRHFNYYYVIDIRKMPKNTKNNMLL